jgi:hypothetical protein
MKSVKIITTDQCGEVSGHHMIVASSLEARAVRAAIKRHFHGDNIVDAWKETMNDANGVPTWRVAINFGDAA